MPFSPEPSSCPGSAVKAPRSTRGSGLARTPTRAQLVWLRRGLSQPGGKLPLFDDSGQRVSNSVIRGCRAAGWVESWFHNPIKPNWEVCRLTGAGHAMLSEVSVVAVDFRRGRSGS